MIGFLLLIGTCFLVSGLISRTHYCHILDDKSNYIFFIVIGVVFIVIAISCIISKDI